MVAIHAPQLDPYPVERHLEVVPAPGRRRDRRSPQAAARYRRRRLGVLCGVAALLIAVVSVIGALTGTSGSAAEAPLSSEPVSSVVGADGVYVVQPGDSLWSIARQLSSDGDPRPLVAELRERHGDVELQVGDRIEVADLVG